MPYTFLPKACFYHLCVCHFGDGKKNWLSWNRDRLTKVKWLAELRPDQIAAIFTIGSKHMIPEKM